MFMMICAFVSSLLFAIATAIGPGSLLALHYSAGKKRKARKVENI
jgi:hypothetical protein